MTDIQLRQDVLDELEFEPSIDAASVGVAVDDGVVTLTGHVSSYAQKLAAEEAARRVRDVRAIVQNIEVRYPSSLKIPDEEIAKRALNSIQWDVTLPEAKINLTVQSGFITLSGEVPWYYQRNAAETAVRRIAGVTGVANKISIEPKVQLGDVKTKIENALKRHAEVEAKAIQVSVRNDTVTLDGKVDNWEERQAVENAAWSAPGVRSVEDHLTITR
jgi:osmotically-inducible protein OsmY